MTRNRILALVGLFLASASSLAAQNRPLEDGVKLIREGHFDQALPELEEAHRLAPRDATIENLLGITETQLSHLDKAAIHYRNAIRLDPSQASPHRNLGFNLLTAKQYRAAEPELREALRLNPNDPFAHYYLFLLALATDHDAEALEHASHAEHLIENDPDAGVGLIESEIRVGRVDEASSRIKNMEAANQLTPVREYAIAALLSQHAFYGQAVGCFQRIALLDPSWESRYNLALALLYDGQFAEASRLLSTLHNERPSNADALMFLGSAFEMQEKMPEALEAYRSAAIADPSNPDRTLDYTRLLMDMDRYDEAIQFIESGKTETASSSPIKLRLGAVEMIKGDYGSARDAFNEALAENPELDAGYVGLAQTYARQGNDTEAIRILEAARSKRPGRCLLEYYFGLMASRLGREDEAVVALDRAAQLDPRSPDPLFELGKIYASKQDWPDARKAFEHAVELNPQFPAGHYQLGQVYAHLGLHAQAQQEAQQTKTLMNTQREEVLRKQREREGRFQPQIAATPVP
jgi:tetratricopeptide (TPR) repeat protein